MRFRSSGLGKQELKGNIADLSPVGGDLLVMRIDTYEPVQWHLRAGIQFSDISTILKAMLKPSVLSLVIRAIFKLQENPQEPEDIMGEF